MSAPIRRPPKPQRAVLYVSQILAWADAFHARHGRWPQMDDGVVEGGPGLTWCAVDQALIKGHRGLVRGQSLAKLLLTHRQKRHSDYLPDLTTGQILVWADAYHQRTGQWPLDRSGGIPEAPGEMWMVVHQALRKGRRGLPQGHSELEFR